MVTISFYYKVSKISYHANHYETSYIMKEGEKSFDSPEKAKRFCYGISRKPDIHISGWKCDSIEENEYMTRNVNLTRINGF